MSPTTRSSHKNRSCSFINALRASYGLNLPLSFATPTTRLTNLMSAASRRSLYSL